MSARVNEDGDQASSELFEDAAVRLREALAIFEAIESGELLAELPRGRRAARKHQVAVSLLTIMRRELEGLADELQAASFVQSALARVTKRTD